MDLSSLSKREREVLGFIIAGHTAKEISRTLGISHRTVECHVEHIFNKTGTNKRTRLAALAATEGLRGMEFH